MRNLAIVLKKGQKVSLDEQDPNLNKVMIGLGWDPNKYSGSDPFDLDASAWLLDKDGKCRNDRDVVCCWETDINDGLPKNLLKHPSGTVIHMGDNMDGGGEGDDEQIFVDLNKIPSEFEKIMFTVTIADAENRKQNFGQIPNSFIRMVNEETDKEILRYDLGEDFSLETIVVFGELYRHNGKWKFGAIGNGFKDGLPELIEKFGLEVSKK